MNIERPVRSNLVALAGLWALGLGSVACSDHRSRNDEHGVSTRAALSQGFDDVNTPEANVVVAMDCTGTLITPRIVLTASHCVWSTTTNGCYTQPRYVATPVTVTTRGSNGVAAGGAAFEAHPAARYAARIDHCFDVDSDIAEKDIAVVYLNEPVTQSSMQRRGGVDVAVPRVSRPKLETPSPENGGVFPWTLGVAGYGNSSHIVRQVLLTRNAQFDVDAAASNFIWLHDDDAWDTDKGDSGGPLFIRGDDGTRHVIGVHHGHRTRPFQSSMVWVDITRGENETWLTQQVTEETVPEPLRHTTLWLTRHGKTLNDWWGELDYSGPCDAIHDRDCDGWWDQNADATHPIHDNCLFVANPGQEDSRDRGVGDACSVCPWDPGNDEDGDGVCAACPLSDPDCHKDNCPKVFNPGQANCNLASERDWNELHPQYHVDELGDACDPVPCPQSNADTVTARPLTIAACDKHPYSAELCVGREIRDLVNVKPVGASRLIGQTDVFTNLVVPATFTVREVPTRSRYCQHNPLMNSDCDAAMLRRERELDAYPSAAEEQPSALHLWHRITLSPDCSGPVKTLACARGISTPQRGLPFLADYGTDNKQFHWSYLDDNKFWTDSTINPLAPLIGDPGNLSCKEAKYGSGTCLDGRIWLNGNTLVGASQEYVGATLVGLHGFELANHFFPAAPDAPFARGGGGLQFQFPFFLFRTLPDPAPFAWRFDRGAATPLIRDGATFFAVFPSGLREPVTELLSSSLRDSLANPALRWVASAEASPFVGDAARPTAVALSADGTRLASTAFFDGESLVELPSCGIGLGDGSTDPACTRSAARRVEAGPVPPPLGTFSAVYSRAHGKLFVLGSSGASEFWELAIDQGVWTRVIPRMPIKALVDVTYSFRDRKLWIVDAETDPNSSHEVRLLRLDPETGAVDVIASSGPRPLDAAYDARGLLVDLDGRIVLYASSSRSQKHRIARIESGVADIAVAITARRHRALAAPPIADLLGFALYYQPDRPPADPSNGPDDGPDIGDKTVAGARLSELPVQPASVAHLRALLR